MARRNGVVVISLAVLFGVLAIALSFGAYATRIKEKDVVKTSYGCIYPHSASFILGMVAALFLLIQQVLISASIGCFCCGRTKCPSACCGIISVILFILSWISFIIAFMGLITTSIFNNKSYLTNRYPENDNDDCKLGRENLFLGGAIWCIITVVFGLISHVTFKMGDRHSRSKGGMLANEGNVAMGQPQMYA